MATKTAPDGQKSNEALETLEKDALTKELTNAEKEYYILSLKHSGRELKQPHLLRQQRRYVARIKTYLTSKA